MPTETPTKTKFNDGDLVQVLHGFGKVHPQSVHFIDNHRFVGGVCKNVPYSLAKHWEKGTRPDGKPSQGRVHVTILPLDAPDTQFAEVAGVGADDLGRIAALFNSTNAATLIAELGPARVKQLVDAMNQYLANTARVSSNAA